MRVVVVLFILMGVFTSTLAYGGRSAIPRFVTLKSDEANLRTGPSRNYHIDWVYKKSGMPIEIIGEFNDSWDHWYKVRDHEGTMGWMHKVLLSGKRNALVNHSQSEHFLRLNSEVDSLPVARIAPDVQVRVLVCKEGWCKVEATGHEGWIPDAALYGVYPGEEIG